MLKTALDVLEEEAIYVIRQVAANFKKPVILFSGGKDSLCVLHLASKAFRPSTYSIPVLHIDTGHNFPETLIFRDKIIRNLGAKLIVRSVPDTIARGSVKDAEGPIPSRNKLQSVTLLESIDEHSFDALIGGARRDEDKARAKEKFFSIREKRGGWNPLQQRIELWDHYNYALLPHQNMRVFPLNNWTELDVWRYIKREQLEVPSLYFAHTRRCLRKSDQSILPLSEYLIVEPGDEVLDMKIRFRTVGDMTCTAPVVSEATTVEDIIKEIEISKLSERGSRVDDRFSETSMEDRKKEGYF